MPQDGKGFGARLSATLARKGWSQTELARALGAREATVSGWVNGTIPNGESLLKLAGALPVDIHWLLTGEAAGPDVDVGGLYVIERVREALDVIQTEIRSPEDDGEQILRRLDDAVSDLPRGPDRRRRGGE